MKQIRYFFLLFLLDLSANHVAAQTYPSFTISQWDSASTGYYFLIPIRTGTGGPAQNATHMILDGRGNVVYFKEFVSGNNTGDFKIQDNGLISYSYQNKFYLMDSTFTIVDSVRCKNGIIQDGHDMQVLPNGHFLLLGWENLTMDLSSYPWFNNNGSAGSSIATVRAGVIQEQDANKNVVFEWHAINHFNFSEVDTTRLNNPSNVDWTHLNSIELDTDGNILASIRHFNEIIKIDRSTGNIMWRLGGKSNDFTFTNDTGMFIGQHDCRRLANGNITLLDNGNPGHPVSGKEYQLDENLMQATLVWSHCPDSGLFSSATGNVQRLTNGNTLLDYGMVDQLVTTFEVVNPGGNTVFQILFNDTLQTYRAFNYETLPWDLQRPVITCTEINQQYFLDAGPGYTTYRWSTGDTTQMIQIPDTGTYSVFVPKGTEGYISAAPFVVSNIADPCSTSSVDIEQLDSDSQLIFPNPFYDKFHVQDSNPSYCLLMNCMGEFLYQGTEVEEQNFSHLASGLYFLKIHSGTKIHVVKILKR